MADRFHHAALLVLTGADADYRRYCKSVYQRRGNALQDVWSARMLALGQGALPDPTTVVALAQEARNASKDEAWLVLVLALAQLRADQVDAAFATLQEFEKISKREWQFSWPSLALMRHKAGKIDEAREWLRKTEDWYAEQWSNDLAGGGSGITKGNLFFWAFFLSLRQEAIATVTGQPAPADPARGDDKQAAEFLTKATLANPKLPAADWLVLALAHAKLKDTDQVKNACAKATELLKPTGADAGLRPLLREVLFVVGSNSPEATALIAAAGGELPAALNEAIEQNPDKADGYRARSDWYGERGRWNEAVADCAEVYRLEPNSYAGLRLGILLVHTGAIDRYREHCQTMLNRWASTENNNEADHTLKTVLFLPDFKADAKQLARLAEVAVSGAKDVDWYEWFLFGKGLHDYRTGKYADAVATCRESRQRASATKGSPEALSALNLSIEAMALHRTGDTTGAKRARTEAKSNLDLFVIGIDPEWWHDRLAAHILYREAESLIAGKKASSSK